MLFMSLPARNLARRPIRSLLTALGIGVAVATVVALIGVSRGVETAWTHCMTERGVHILGMKKGSVEVLTGTIEQAAAARIARVPGVKAVAGELVDLVQMEGAVIAVAGWSQESFLWMDLRLKEGRVPSARDPKEAVIGQRLAERLKLKVGDKLPFMDTRFTIVGISRQAGTLNENGLVIPLPVLQRQLSKEGRITFVNLRLEDPGDPQKVARVQSSLAEGFPALLFQETKDLSDTNQMLKLLRQMSWSISLIALVMGLFFIVNTLLMSVMERTREMGILSALGWGRGRIWAVVMLEGVLLAAVGSALGLGAGMLGLNGLSSLDALEGFIEPATTGSFLAEVFLAAILLGVMGSLYPAWRTSRLRTVDALKYE